MLKTGEKVDKTKVNRVWHGSCNKNYCKALNIIIKHIIKQVVIIIYYNAMKQNYAHIKYPLYINGFGAKERNLWHGYCSMFRDVHN